MVEITYSTRGKKCSARWYPRPDRISIFLNKISLQCNPETDFEGFIANLCSLEFHELAHIYGFRNGCHPVEKCRNDQCYLCRLTCVMYLYFKYGNWSQVAKTYLKTGEVKENHDLTNKCPECGSKDYSNEDELGKRFRLCIQCKQEWWTDINYKEK